MRLDSQAGRHGFEPRLPLQQPLLFVLVRRNQSLSAIRLRFLKIPFAIPVEDIELCQRCQRAPAISADREGESPLFFGRPKMLLVW